MRDPTVPKLQKWPFLAGDALLLASAYFIQAQGAHPLRLLESGLLVVCVAAGSALAVLPFVLEYRALLKRGETDSLISAVAQLQKVETVAEQIKTATGLWQNAQDAADKTAASAQEIAERMSAEAKSFIEFMERANDSEKSALRLELEKFRRAEGEWIQVLVRVLDHIYALHQGALKSGQPNLIEQLSRFQRACYDAARRIGLAAFVAVPAEPFNEERHQPADGNSKAPPGAIVEETLATGYTYQGKVARRALVRLRGDSSVPPESHTEQARKRQEPVGSGGQAQRPMQGSLLPENPPGPARESP